MKKENLIEAANELNDLLFDEANKDKGWIYTEESTKILKEGIMDAALLLEEGDELEENTIEVLKEMDWSSTDFNDLAEGLNPLPLFVRHGIIEIPDPEPHTEEEPPEEPDPVDLPSKAEEPPKKPKKEKPVKAELPNEAVPAKHASAYGTALAIMGTTPTMPLHELYEIMKKRGFDLKRVGNSTKTAHSIHKKVVTNLRNNGFLNEEAIKAREKKS